MESVALPFEYDKNIKVFCPYCTNENMNENNEIILYYRWDMEMHKRIIHHYESMKEVEEHGDRMILGKDHKYQLFGNYQIPNLQIIIFIHDL